MKGLSPRPVGYGSSFRVGILVVVRLSSFLALVVSASKCVEVRVPGKKSHSSISTTAFGTSGIHPRKPMARHRNVGLFVRSPADLTKSTTKSRKLRFSSPDSSAHEKRIECRHRPCFALNMNPSNIEQNEKNAETTKNKKKEEKRKKEEKTSNLSLLVLYPDKSDDSSSILTKNTIFPDDRFMRETYKLTFAALIGVVSGLAVAEFKLAIEAIRQLCYGTPLAEHIPLLFIPVLGGLAVSILGTLGEFPPGLRGTVYEVDDESMSSTLTPSSTSSSSSSEGDFTTAMTSWSQRDPFRFIRKTLAAIFTLGTGCSLGPEGPSVEVGMFISRLCMNVKPPNLSPVVLDDNGVTSDKNYGADTSNVMRRNRLLLSCGAAAGVSAGFNAPIAGVFFALEVVQAAFPPLGPFSLPPIKVEDGSESLTENSGETTAPPPPQSLPVQDSALSVTSGAISAILLSSVLAALVSQVMLGNELALSLRQYTLKTPLLEMPLYLILGALSGLVAFAFSQSAKISKSVFEGEAGPPFVRDAMSSLPSFMGPVLGGLICGVVGIAFPQILFFGYETLNNLLANDSLPTALLLTLLVVKIFTTAVSAGSGLVGGTLAPSLFLGGMAGASFHNVVANLFEVLNKSSELSVPPGPVLELADVPAYAMVGAASVLAALFRAPLTASLLLFELTRDYDVILPLMASAGVANLVGDIVENKFIQKTEEQQRRDKDSVSWGDLSDEEEDAVVVNGKT